MPVSQTNSRVVYDALKKCGIGMVSALPETWLVHLLLSYVSQYGAAEEGNLFPDEREIRERLGAIARFYGNQIGVKYGEPFVVKEAMQVHDIVAMPVRSM